MQKCGGIRQLTVIYRQYLEGTFDRIENFHNGTHA